MENERKNSILIVDDEELNRFALKNILNTEYNIHIAESGAEAVEKAKQYLPDLILLDVVMPGIDGYQTVSEIQKCDKIKNTPVIFVTGLDDVENEKKGLELNAIDYITKPYDFEIIRLRIHNHIQRINQLRITKESGLLDMLTGLPNRRDFDSKIEKEWKRAVSEQKHISILLIDIDKFKTVNDTYGHQQGDNVLKSVSGILLQEFKRDGDLIARWGGEEFVALLPDTPLEKAIEIADKIRLSVEKAEIPCGDQILKVTVSIGINSQIPETESTMEDFIKKVDVALYNAKHNGRNRLCW